MSAAPSPLLRYELRYEWNDPERNASIHSGTQHCEVQHWGDHGV